jgi:hypothetical protein
LIKRHPCAKLSDDTQLSEISKCLQLAKRQHAHAPNPLPGTPALFPYQRWEKLLPELAVQHKAAVPYPHIHLVNLLDEDVIANITEEFLRPHETEWTH